MKKMWLKTILVLGIVVLMFGAGVTPSLINGIVKGDNPYSGHEWVIGRVNTNLHENHVVSENSLYENAIYFYNQVAYIAFGLSDDGGTAVYAIRITPGELVGYDGWQLIAVRFYHNVQKGTNETHYCDLKIYDSGTATLPGLLLESVPYTATGTGWVRITLPTPIQLDINQDIWISIEITHAGGEFPMGADGGPAVDGKGDWFCHPFWSWYELQYQANVVPAGVSYETNWNIEGIVADRGGNHPPNRPTITGPASGNVSTAYDYNFTAIDFEGDEVYYFIDWGDTTNSGWLGPFASGEQIIKSHAWSKKAAYMLKAKAKDIYGNESDWRTLEVTMPVSINLPFHQLIEKLFQRFPNAFPILRQLLGY